mmetsp:Transcript_22425/g.55772  ORF Transcript_22425/g.55772 Transcript_22425/m.55772 type:complete len:224 (+) Transcript_22425:100-771(+)
MVIAFSLLLASLTFDFPPQRASPTLRHSSPRALTPPPPPPPSLDPPHGAEGRPGAQLPRSRLPLAMLAGGGEPGVARLSTPSLPAEAVVDNLLRALQKNDSPEVDAGLRAFWAWTHELYRGRPVNGHGDFQIFAARAVRSELAPLLGSTRWVLEPINPVGDGSKYATHVARVWPAGDEGGKSVRRYLFQLRREQRPPYNGAWSVWGVIVSDSVGSIQDLSGGF